MSPRCEGDGSRSPGRARARLWFRPRASSNFPRSARRCGKEEMGKWVRSGCSRSNGETMRLPHRQRQEFILAVGYPRNAARAKQKLSRGESRRAFVFMGFSFFRMTDKNLWRDRCPPEHGGQIWIQRQRPLEFGDALLRTVGLVQDAAHDLVAARASFGRRESTLPIAPSAAARRASKSSDRWAPPTRIVDPPDTEQRVEIVGIERHSALKKSAAQGLRHDFSRG